MRYCFLLLSWLFIKLSTSACTCVPDGNPIQQEFKETDIVLSGKVISVDTAMVAIADLKAYRQFLEVKLQITNIFKGQALRNTIVITSQVGGCGRPFFVGYDYVVYGYKIRLKQIKSRTIQSGDPIRKGLIHEKVIRYSTNICMRTTEDVEQEVKELKIAGLIKENKS